MPEKTSSPQRQCPKMLNLPTYLSIQCFQRCCTKEPEAPKAVCYPYLCTSNLCLSISSMASRANQKPAALACQSAKCIGLFQVSEDTQSQHTMAVHGIPPAARGRHNVMPKHVAMSCHNTATCHQHSISCTCPRHPSTTETHPATPRVQP
jgi:hypothetical protein